MIQEYDVVDTPYMAHQIGKNLWAVYCSRHRVVFPVEITEKGPLHAVPWEPVAIDDLSYEAQRALQQYAAYHQARVVEDGCSH